MNYDIINGGLAVRALETLIVTDVLKYSGTYMLDYPGEPKLLDSGIFWFMNVHNDTIFFSDQTLTNSICKYDLQNGVKSIVLEKPCCGLYVQVELIFYINEADGRLYKCSLNGSNEYRLTNEAVISFIIENDRIFYSTESGIMACSTEGHDVKKISEHIAVSLILHRDRLIYINKSNNYILTILNLQDQSVESYNDIRPSSINIRANHLYCSNVNNDSSIYRMELDHGNSIRICGEGGKHIHILNEELLFITKNGWSRISLNGGNSTVIPL